LCFTRAATTTEDVCATCRRDMRPFARLPSVSGVDSKLGHRQLGRDYTRCASFPSRFYVCRDVDFWPVNKKLPQLLTPAWKRSHRFWYSYTFFCELGAGTGQTDRQTDGQARRVMRLRAPATTWLITYWLFFISPSTSVALLHRESSATCLVSLKVRRPWNL